MEELTLKCGAHSATVPREALSSGALAEIFSEDVWRNRLTEEDRKRLQVCNLLAVTGMLQWRADDQSPTVNIAALHIPRRRFLPRFSRTNLRCRDCFPTRPSLPWRRCSAALRHTSHCGPWNSWQTAHPLPPQACCSVALSLPVCRVLCGNGVRGLARLRGGKL